MTRYIRILLVAVLAVVALGVASPSYAATYPTLSTGSTGANAVSLQYLPVATLFHAAGRRCRATRNASRKPRARRSGSDPDG